MRNKPGRRTGLLAAHLPFQSARISQFISFGSREDASCARHEIGKTLCCGLGCASAPWGMPGKTGECPGKVVSSLDFPRESCSNGPVYLTANGKPAGFPWWNKTLAQRRFNAGAASETPGRHWNDVASRTLPAILGSLSTANYSTNTTNTFPLSPNNTPISPRIALTHTQTPPVIIPERKRHLHK